MPSCVCIIPYTNVSDITPHSMHPLQLSLCKCHHIIVCRRNKFTRDQKERLKKAVTERNSKEGMTELELFI